MSHYLNKINSNNLKYLIKVVKEEDNLLTLQINGNFFICKKNDFNLNDKMEYLEFIQNNFNKLVNEDYYISVNDLKNKYNLYNFDSLFLIYLGAGTITIFLIIKKLQFNH